MGYLSLWSERFQNWHLVAMSLLTSAVRLVWWWGQLPPLPNPDNLAEGRSRPGTAVLRRLCYSSLLLEALRLCRLFVIAANHSVS